MILSFAGCNGRVSSRGQVPDLDVIVGSVSVGGYLAGISVAAKVRGRHTHAHTHLHAPTLLRASSQILKS